MDAVKLAQRLLEAIAETTVAHNERLLGVTASLGVGTLDDGDVADAATPLERADQALYAAKNSGRNQLQVWRKPISDKAFDWISVVPRVFPG